MLRLYLIIFTIFFSNSLCLCDFHAVGLGIYLSFTLPDLLKGVVLSSRC